MIGRVGAFEAPVHLGDEVEGAGILEAIRDRLEIKPDTEKKLTAFLDSFAKILQPERMARRARRDLRDVECPA